MYQIEKLKHEISQSLSMMNQGKGKKAVISAYDYYIQPTAHSKRWIMEEKLRKIYNREIKQ